MELDDLKFVAVGVLLAVSGIVALLLALTGVVSGVPVAAALALPGVALLIASHELSPADHAAIRLAARASVAAAAIWGLMWVVAGNDPAATPAYLSLVAASLWARHFLTDSLAGPWWARSDHASHRKPGQDACGWIEDLPA